MVNLANQMARIRLAWGEVSFERKKEEKRERERESKHGAKNFVIPPTPPWKMSRNRDTGKMSRGKCRAIEIQGVHGISGVGVCAG